MSLLKPYKKEIVFGDYIVSLRRGIYREFDYCCFCKMYVNQVCMLSEIDSTIVDYICNNKTLIKQKFKYYPYDIQEF